MTAMAKPNHVNGVSCWVLQAADWKVGKASDPDLVQRSPSPIKDDRRFPEGPLRLPRRKAFSP